MILRRPLWINKQLRLICQGSPQTASIFAKIQHVGMVPVGDILMLPDNMVFSEGMNMIDAHMAGSERQAAKVMLQPTASGRREAAFEDALLHPKAEPGEKAVDAPTFVCAGQVVADGEERGLAGWRA